MTIELKGVTFEYPEARERPILSIERWSVPRGRQVFVHGPSGSGKTTLLNLISGLRQCSSGEVTVFGERMDLMSRRRRDRFRANHIGYIFQRLNLIPYLNAVENVELARSFSVRRHHADAPDEIESLLDSLNVESSGWQRPITQLSMGQQQRVAIARALVNRPGLIIADEPTSAMDEENRDTFLGVLMPLVAEHDITLLFVSHDMALAHYFAQVQALTDINRAG